MIRIKHNTSITIEVHEGEILKDEVEHVLINVRYLVEQQIDKGMWYGSDIFKTYNKVFHYEWKSGHKEQ